MKRALGANIFAGRLFLKAMSPVDQWEKGVGNSYHTRIFEKKNLKISSPAHSHSRN